MVIFGYFSCSFHVSKVPIVIMNVATTAMLYPNSIQKMVMLLLSYTPTGAEMRNTELSFFAA